MTNEQKAIQSKIIGDLIKRHDSQRAFARIINEDPADVVKWRNATLAVKPRAVLTLVKLFKIDPHLLRPDIFQEGIKITFKGD